MLSNQVAQLERERERNTTEAKEAWNRARKLQDQLADAQQEADKAKEAQKSLQKEFDKLVLGRIHPIIWGNFKAIDGKCPIGWRTIRNSSRSWHVKLSYGTRKWRNCQSKAPLRIG
jgi:hypothetical protein